MIQYNFTCKEIFRRSFKITDRIQKRMNTDVAFKIIFLEEDERKKQKYPFEAVFYGCPTTINQSNIEIIIPAIDELKGNHKLRQWNAALIITTIHETCHWLIFKKMSIKERKASNACYSEEKAWGEIEETHAWVATLRWLKKLRYHRSPVILEELQKFVYPDGFQIPPPFCKKRKNAAVPIQMNWKK